ncbi:MAG: hypothetical protein AAFO86_13190, partial [Pseudomonadota bacterium]
MALDDLETPHSGLGGRRQVAGTAIVGHGPDVGQIDGPKVFSSAPPRAPGQLAQLLEPGGHAGLDPGDVRPEGELAVEGETEMIDL